ncbi:hypothetical protein Mapa_010642 [Marchantia paleacea]|nr:hypothetical protein Mapa_010642 [Marchantia paleacea]
MRRRCPLSIILLRLGCIHYLRSIGQVLTLCNFNGTRRLEANYVESSYTYFPNIGPRSFFHLEVSEHSLQVDK